MNRTELLESLVERLQEFGLQVEVGEGLPRVDGANELDLVLSRSATEQKFALKLTRRATLASLGHELAPVRNSLPLLIGAGSVSPRSSEAFRRAGIQHVDVAGNAWIRFSDVLIDVRGRRAAINRVSSTPRTGANLFSTGRAQVAFVLLQWPRLWTQPQRSIAEAAGVSLGQAHNALSIFRNGGFGPGGHRSDSEFLDLWVASYPSGLAQKLTLASYRGPIEDLRKVTAGDRMFVAEAAISGEAAVDDQLRSATLTIYVVTLDPMLPVKNRWRSDGNANITVRRKFWTVPSDETYDDDRKLAGVRMAPSVLVYADLMASADPRVRSTAPKWRKTHCST